MTTTTASVSTSHNIKIAVCADIHGRRFLRSEIPSDVALTLFAGDIAYLPHNVANHPETIVETEIGKLLDTVSHMKAWPGKKVVVPGNHDHYIEEAFEFEHPAPPPGRLVGRNRRRLTESQKTRIREALQTDEGNGWYFLQHESRDITVEGHTLRVFGSGFSLFRNTDGYCFLEGSAESAKLFKAMKGADIVLTHGPPECDLLSLQVGEIVNDRDSIDSKVRGSLALFRAIFKTMASLVAHGHIHNGYSYRNVKYSDGSTGLLVNAAAVITGYKHDVMPVEGWRSEYRTPRPPIVVYFDTITRKSTVVSSWDGTIRGISVKPPFWAAPIRRMSEDEFRSIMGSDAELSDASLIVAWEKYSRKALEEDQAQSWLGDCGEDQAKRPQQEKEEGVWGDSTASGDTDV